MLIIYHEKDRIFRNEAIKLRLSGLDWVIIAGFVLSSLVLGIYLSRRASASMGDFFLSGRSLPWWLAGTSMVATSFSCDTPLYITSIVRSGGVYSNWQWWSFLFGGIFAMAFLARLWRRSGVLTDVELIELRYSGKAASVLRGVKAVYFSCIIHTIIKAQVILAMAKIVEVTVGWDKWLSIVVVSAVPLTYSVAAGLWGVVITDFLQFLIAMFGALALAVISVKRVGGMGALKDALPPDVLAFVPPGEFTGLAFMTFLGYIGLSWWSKYSSDGGGVVVQRISSCKTEGHGYAATLFFNIANYGLRTWPWVVAALASIVLYPAATDGDAVYAIMVVDLLPSGIRGLMLASFLAAFMSTLSTYLNLSSAYFVNDFYAPYVARGRTQKHYVRVSRAMTIVLSVLTAVATYYAESIEGVFTFLIAFGSGTGLVYILRWFWWRINAWSEISAMATSTIMAVVMYRVFPGEPYVVKLLSIISVSTAVWLTVTFTTPRVEREKLIAFVRRIRPSGPGWGKIRREAGEAEAIRYEPMLGAFIEWALGSVLVAGLTIGTGKALLGSPFTAALWLGVAAMSSLGLYMRLKPERQQ